LSKHEFSDATIEFYTKLSDSVLLCVAVLPLLSLLGTLLNYLLKSCCGGEDAGGAADVNAADRRARDIEEEAAIKEKAALSS